MRLVSPEHYEEIFAPLRGKRIGYVRGENGNVGDTMQERGAWELCLAFGLDVTWLGPVPAGREPWDWCLDDGCWNGKLRGPCDELLLFGGGNMGLPGPSMRLREKAARLKLPMTVLPNSWRAPERLRGGVRYFMRESASGRWCPEALLAPDLALGVEFDPALRAVEPGDELGVFLRNDQEARWRHACGRINRGPAFDYVRKPDVDGYLRLAAYFRRIVTDVLHFAIAGLMAGREVTLVPGTYHKQRGMYDCWLRELGCRWAEDPRTVQGVA